jgi:hypothetical protein
MNPAWPPRCSGMSMHFLNAAKSPLNLKVLVLLPVDASSGDAGTLPNEDI